MNPHYPTFDPDVDDPLFWVIHAAKTASMHEALIEAWHTSFIRRPKARAFQDAISLSAVLFEAKVKKEFESVKNDGVLLFAWAGSTALKGGAS